MSARVLQQKIHSDFSTGQAVWDAYKTEINDLYNADPNIADFHNHVMREFNRKINVLGISSGLYFSPYDAGFRFIG